MCPVHRNCLHGPEPGTKPQGAQAKLALAALGVVFGDISTSPIYAIRECFHGEYGIEVTPANVMGILSLMFWALVVTIAILIGIFLIQRRGTARVGGLFGPVILLWPGLLMATGLVQIWSDPKVLAAIDPGYGLRFLLDNRMYGLVVLGAIFLVVTGTQALYADMGHFGTGSIRLT